MTRGTRIMPEQRSRSRPMPSPDSHFEPDHMVAGDPGRLIVCPRRWNQVTSVRPRGYPAGHPLFSLRLLLPYPRRQLSGSWGTSSMVCSLPYRRSGPLTNSALAVLLAEQRIGRLKTAAPVFIDSNRFDPAGAVGGAHQLGRDWCARVRTSEFWTNVVRRCSKQTRCQPRTGALRRG